MIRRSLTALAAALLAALLLTPLAQASQAIDSFSVSSSTAAAGGHPDLFTQIAIQDPGNPEAAQSVRIAEPEGMFGNPHAITVCTSSDFALDQCPTTSQAGVVTIHAAYNGDPDYLLGSAPVYDVQTQSSDETARFAFIAPTVNIPISIPVTVRTASDYGLDLTVTGISQSIPLAGAEITIWGFPYDASHDNERFRKGSPGDPAGCPGEADATCASLHGSAPNSAGIAPTPLTDNPTVCTGQPLTATADVLTYQDPGHPSHAQATYPPITGCEHETFNPVANINLTSDETDSPSGLDLQLKSPQFEGLTASPSQIRSATVVLPPGLNINPDAADGQRACTDAEANFGSDAPSQCPDNSKIGNFDITTPALDGPLVGSLYFGEPRPGDQYRVFMIADGFGIHSKLFASVKPDPDTGQLTLTALDLPQVPFEAFDMHLFASDRGLLATPNYCTVYATDAFFVPWNDALAPQHSRPNLSLDSGPNNSSCPAQVRPFHPRLVAGMSTPAAGAFSSFTLKLDRDDGDQTLGDLNFTMPPGFTGNLRGISYCPEQAIAHAAQNPGLTEQAIPSCPASSLIGSSNVAAGPGSHPFHAVGRMYLAGPFKGAPLSLVAITPALAGPYDYGTVVVRVAVHVDSLDAHVVAISDTVPSIIGGVPIRMRSIQVNIDRTDSSGNPNFTINPTNCSPFSIDSQGIGDQGTITDFSSYFHAVNCSALGFKPHMTMTQVSGATHRSSNPGLRLTLDTRAGDANIKSLVVTLSNAFQIDQRHLGNICTETELVKDRCAGKAQIGTASTTTPLLDQPLTGPVYAVSGSGGLPRLAFILAGQVTLIPRADAKNSKGSRLQTTVPVVPDAPIGHFVFDLNGGNGGYLVTTRSLCTSPVVSSVSYVAQNGRTLAQKLPLRAKCPKAGKARHKRQLGHHHH